MRWYLVGLGDDSERVTLAALDSVADILSGGKVSALELAWHGLRHGHVNALRGRLQQFYASWPPCSRRVRKTPARPSGPGTPRSWPSSTAWACGGPRPWASRSPTSSPGISRSGSRGRGTSSGSPTSRAESQAALEAWLGVRGRKPGGLFCGVTKGGKLTYWDVSPQFIYRVVQKRHLEVGIVEFTPHDLRRSHISDLLDEGVDLVVIARQVGHSSVQTTAAYGSF